MAKNPGNKGLQDVGGWCGILGGGAMLLILAYLGTVLFQSNAGLDWGKRLAYIPAHRVEYRFCWSAMIVISTGLLPLIFALYQVLREKAGTLALLGSASGALALLFNDVVGAVRASAVPSMAMSLQAVKGGPMALRNALVLDFLFTEKFAFNVDNYMVTGLFALSAVFLGAALGSVARYPKSIVYGLYLTAILGLVGILEDLLFHSMVFHIREYDYNVFVSASVILLLIFIVAIGARLVSGKNP